jgi:signal transduction histidine kinase
MYRVRIERLEQRLRGTLIAGFGLLLLLMLTLGWMTLRALGRMEAGAEQLAERYVGESELMDRLQRHEADIGQLLFMLGQEPDRGARLAEYRGQVDQQRASTAQLLTSALKQPLEPGERTALAGVEGASRQLFAEMDSVIGAGRTESPGLSAAHRRFTASIADLMDAGVVRATAERAQETNRDEDLVSGVRRVVIGSLAIALICAALCVAAALWLFHRVQLKAEALAQLSIHNLAEQEDAARRFSREMHDEFGQTLNAIESQLAVLPPTTPESRERIDDALMLTKEAQQMAREMSQLLRPRILDDLGLDAGLRELANGYSKRTGIVVDYTSNWRERLEADAETHLFRIAQEALTNVSRHTMARTVALSLDHRDGALTLRINDDGGGFTEKDGPSKSLGLIGMTERARAIGGDIKIQSTPGRGVEIQVKLGNAVLPRLMAQAVTHDA